MFDTLVKIRHYVDTNTLEYHENDLDVKAIREKQPKLYSMVCSQNCDLSMLYNLITLQEQVANGHITKEEADKLFGEVAAKKYVYPLVNEKLA